MDTAIIALILSFISLGFTVYFWAKNFRPIVTAMVKTYAAGTKGIAFNLEIRNSGSLPAKNIRVRADQGALKKAFGDEATPENIKTETACFDEECIILILHNDSVVCCPFGHTKEGATGFWKYDAIIPITIEYEGWLGWVEKWKRCFKEHQKIQIKTSASFTGYEWGEVSRKKEIVTLAGDEIPKKIQELIPGLTVTYNKYPPSPPT